MLTTVLFIGCIKTFLTEAIIFDLRPKFTTQIYDPDLVQNLGKKGQILFSDHNIANV